MYSAAKAISTTVVHMLVERGELDLDARVCDYLPTYTSHGKDRTTVRHVVTHSAGVPLATGPRPDLKRMNDSEYAREMLGNLRPIYRPGLVHMYHGLTWGPLIREIVSAATGRNIRDILASEILEPLGFRWTNYGVAPEDVPLVAPSHVTGKPLPAPMAAAFKKAVGGTPSQIIPFSNTPDFLTSVVPSSSTVSNALSSCRGSPSCCAAAANSTAFGCYVPKRCAPQPHRAGACGPTSRSDSCRCAGAPDTCWAPSDSARSRRNAPDAFGHTGLTNIAVWADPARNLAAAVVSSGKPGGHPEAKRYPALLDAIARDSTVRVALKVRELSRDGDLPSVIELRVFSEPQKVPAFNCIADERVLIEARYFRCPVSLKRPAARPTTDRRPRYPGTF